MSGVRRVPRKKARQGSTHGAPEFLRAAECASRCRCCIIRSGRPHFCELPPVNAGASLRQIVPMRSLLSTLIIDTDNHRSVVGHGNATLLGPIWRFELHSCRDLADRMLHPTIYQRWGMAKTEIWSFPPCRFGHPYIVINIGCTQL